MEFKKLIFTEEDKSEISRWRRELSKLVLESGEMEKIIVGGCGGVCYITCSNYCVPTCEPECSDTCKNFCSAFFSGSGGCLFCSNVYRAYEL
jgi:hypothetical protein